MSRTIRDSNYRDTPFSDGDDNDNSSITQVSPYSPLLGPQELSHQSTLESWFLAKRPRSISALVCFAIFLWVFSGTIAIVPGTKLAEEIFCRRYYGRDTPIDENMCKVEEIQSKIAYIFGFSITVNGLVGMLVAFPFGVLADRARKPIYFLGSLGQVLGVAWMLFIFYFSDRMPVELVLLSPIFEVFGGGLTVATAILYAIISDVQTSENKTISYFFFSLSAQSAFFVGPPIGSKLTEIWSPWVPLSASLVISILAGSIVLLVPETADIVESRTNDEDSRKRGWYRFIVIQIKHQVKAIRNSQQLLRKRSVLLILLAFMLITPIALGTGTTFLQYYSTRFHKTLEEAGYMLAIKGGLTVLVMGIFLPGLSRFSSSPNSPIRLSAFRKDLLLAQVSAAFLCLGFLALAGPNTGFIIRGLVILTFGSGLGPLCRSILTNFVQHGQTSQLFTLVSIVETIGSLAGGPVLAWTFSTGLKLQDFWIGLPYIFLSALSFLVFTVLLMIRNENYVDDESRETSLL
ncbi:MFS general substrate transporter [Daldinia sp. FL1419]|nr:MFS general substrate transporter [Daldinia sp. FL1419]